MGRVAVVTDSSTCLPAALVDKLGIVAVPVTVHLPDADGIDGADHLSRRISEAVARDQYVRSTHPYITDYLAAIEESAPAPVISAALYDRFSSRGEADFADKVLSAMRFEFGGHLEKPAKQP